MRCRDIDMLMSQHWGNCWNRCHDIVVNVVTLRRSFLLSSRIFFACFPHFISTILVHAREYKSINVKKKKKNLNSSMNSNTKIFNSINPAYIHCIAEIFTQLFNKGIMKLLSNFQLR